MINKLTHKKNEGPSYKKDLQHRHINMIAIGGAIGTGLFLGAGGRLQQVGPALALVYILCGAIAFLVLRALGEMVMYRPSSGSFVSYAREFLGEKGAYVAGWANFVNWATTGIADATAVALYFQYWNVGSQKTQWLVALIALLFVTGINLLGVKYFGEMEFWFAGIKVAALVAFLLVGLWVLGSRHQIDGHTPGFQLISQNGGLFPHGVLPAIMLSQGVIFAYAAIEIIGITAGETENPRKVIPKAVNAVIWRIAIFYVGSVLILTMVLPWTAYAADTSPFVTFFDKLGIPGSANIMNFVVITAAMSSLNSGIYANSRTLRNMGVYGTAPKITTKMSERGVPVGAIGFTLGFSVIGIILNYIVPSSAFEVVLNLSSVAIITMWMIILYGNLKFRKRVQSGELPEQSFQMPFAPYTNWIALAFLALVLIMSCFDYPVGMYTILIAVPIIAIALVIGWYKVRDEIDPHGSHYAEHQKKIQEEHIEL
ncbi:MAG: amino acid permease [Micrococcaceae bacterium]